MAIDEFLFGKIAGYFKEKKRRAAVAEQRTATLESLRSRLSLTAGAVTGQAVEIFPAEQEGGYKNDAFFLPATCGLFPSREQNYRFYLYRVLYLSIQKKLKFNWLHTENDRTTEESRRKARETAPQVLEVLFEEYPVTQRWHDEFLEYLNTQTSRKKDADSSHFLYGKWMRNTEGLSETNPLQNIGNQANRGSQAAVQTTLKARIVEEIRQLTVDRKAQEDYVLTHNFEKVETADEFNGVWRDFDGDDDLKDHQNALDELNMKYTVRVDDPVHSVYQADFLENTSVSESAEIQFEGSFIPYDEWDFSKRAYKPAFCKLYPELLHQTNPAYYHETIRTHQPVLTGLRKMLATLNNKTQQQRRQTQGEAFDIDAVTDLFTDVHSGHTPSEKIYLSSRKKEKDLSVLLLLDVSMSSDSYAAGNRIIDVEKQVSILFGEILSEFQIDFSILGFYSKTRNYTACINLKTFEDDWQKARFKIGAVEPGGYTRIGTALRHAGALLNRRPCRNKWLILISDGKPNDFDRYEGKYGIQDVKQALRELNERHINAHALTIEANAKHYLPQMFGQGNYQILSSPTELLAALVQVFEKIRYK